MTKEESEASEKRLAEFKAAKAAKNKDSGNGAAAGTSGPSNSCKKCGMGNHNTNECKYTRDCGYCKKTGHKEAVCHRKKKGLPRINMLRTRPVESEPAQSTESESEDEHEATMMVLQVNAIERKRKKTKYQLLVDSGADTGGAHDKELIPIRNNKESDVSTCEEGGSLKSQGRGTMSFELPSGVQLDVPDSIYAKGLAHNVVGTTVLNKMGITAIFHNGRTYLVEADSFQISSTCTVLVDTPVDKETGLPFVDVKPIEEAANVNALHTASPEKKQEMKIKNEVARAKQINANRRKSQSDRLEALNSEALDSTKLGRLNSVELNKQINLSRVHNKKCEEDTMLFHQKFGHCSARNLDKTLERPMSTVLGFCEACAVGSGESHPHNAFKNKQKPKQEKKELTKGEKELEKAKARHNYKPGERLSTDMFGPWTRSQGGGYYAELMVDPESNYGTIAILTHKGDLIDPTTEMIVEFNSISGRKVREVRADGDGSYGSKEWKATLHSKDIRATYSSPNDQAQNPAEGRVRIIKRDVRTLAVSSGCPNDMWAEAALYANTTRNELRSQKRGEDWVTPTMVLSGSDKPLSPKLMMPFGVKCVVSISKNDREGKQTLTQDAGWSGIFVGYGVSTGHGGAYRIYDPVRKKVMRVSINKCTMDLTCYPWRSRKEWQAKKIDLPSSMAPTAEALLDQEEIDKYCFNDDMLREATDQLSSQFNHPEEPFTGSFGDTAEGHSNTTAVDQGLVTPSEEPTIKTEDHQNMRRFPEPTSPFTGKAENDVTDDPALYPLPSLEHMTPAKKTPHAEEQEAVGIVAGEEEKVPIRAKRSTKPIDRLGSEAQAPKPPPKPKGQPVKPPSEYTGRHMKEGAGGKGKAERFAIDGVGKRWTEDGVPMVSMHWEGYPDKDNAIMTEAYARKQGYGNFIEFYDAQQEVTPEEEETPKEVDTSGPKVNLIQLLGNEMGSCLERK